MYGIITAMPRCYVRHGGDDEYSRTIDVKEIDGYNGPMEFKLKIRSSLVPLFIDCEDYYSKNRERAITTLTSNIPSFKKWYDNINNVGSESFTRTVGWYGVSKFYVAIKLEIFFTENDIEYLE